MKSTGFRILSINGGSSSIKFALYETDRTLRCLLNGKIDRIGLGGTRLATNDSTGRPQVNLKLEAGDFRVAANFLLDWLATQKTLAPVGSVGQRVVHGRKHSEPERITAGLLAELRCIAPYAPDHLPLEIGMMEAFRSRHPRPSWKWSEFGRRARR